MRKHILALALALSAAFVLTGQNTDTGKTEYRTEKNINYRGMTGDHYTDSICKLDLYYPADTKDFPTIIWYHGGSLTGGKRNLPKQLKGQGFAIATVDYRLSPRARVPEIIDDAAAAVKWVVDNIERYGGSTEKLFLSGHSAGGYLTFMLGLDKQYLAAYGIDPDETFAALIPYSGQVITHATSRRERGIKVNSVVDEMAPLYHVRPDCPPVIIITGDREMELAGRYEESAYIWRMFRLAGHPDVTLYELDGFTHSGMADPGHYITIKYIREWEKRQAEKAAAN